jgi:hypothetical protein
VNGHVERICDRTIDIPPICAPTICPIVPSIRQAQARVTRSSTAKSSCRGGRGLADYYKLQGDLARGRTDRFLCYTFNLLYLYGFDLRGAALIDRKQTLYKLLRILCT